MTTTNKNKTNKDYTEFDIDEFLNLPNELGMTAEEFDKFINDYLSGNLSTDDFENIIKNK